MSSCLVRQGRKVKEGIGSLQANLHYTEARIKGTYKEVSMQLQGYCLHTMLVHKGHNWEYQHIKCDIQLYFTHWRCFSLHNILHSLSGDDSIDKSILKEKNPVYSARSDDSLVFTCLECFTLHPCMVFLGRCKHLKIFTCFKCFSSHPCNLLSGR